MVERQVHKVSENCTGQRRDWKDSPTYYPLLEHLTTVIPEGFGCRTTEL